MTNTNNNWHIVSGQGKIQFTDAEQAVWESEQTERNAGATDRQWAAIRQQRDTLISATDWRVLPDQPVSQPWISYRQALRDITLQADPFNIVWPVAP